MAPTCYGNTAESLLNYAIVIFNAHLDGIGIQFLFYQIIYYVTLALAIIVFVFDVVTRLITNPVLNTPGFFLWAITIGVFYHQMWPCDRQFGWMWMGGWWLLFHAFTFSFKPPTVALLYGICVWAFSWASTCVIWVAIIVGLGFAFRPDQSLGGFALWAVTLYAIQFGANIIYVFYLLASHGGEAGHAGFRWAQDTGMPTTLLPCVNIATVEWHDFSAKEEFSSKFKIPNARPEAYDIAVSDFPESPCHLCCLIWYSISPIRQEQMCQELIEAEDNPPESTGSEHILPPRPRDPSAELRIKVWEERPLSPYTYLQLHWGETSIGSRILVCRESRESRAKPFATPSPAIGSFKTNSAEHFEQAKKWLRMCQEGHKLCEGIGDARLDLPKRMLYVSGGKDWTIDKPPEAVKLVQASRMEPDTAYLALSHCWGKPEDMGFKLTATNIDACFESINFSGLSNNIKDAIVVTISMGFSYIWIDSLCILQRDYNNEEDGRLDAAWRKDWEAEAKKMRSVYSGAVCTVASTGSSNSAGGCFHGRSRTSLEPCRVGVSSPDALLPQWIYARKDDIIEFQRGVVEAPLSRRGWAIQERLLSRRILHFGADMMLWECCGRSASELNPHGYTYKKFSEDFSDYYKSDHYYGADLDGPDPRVSSLDGPDLGISSLGLSVYRRAHSELRRRALVKSRPSPAIVDPDAPHDSQGLLGIR
ncbi:hypothetical protein O1611_g6257 [Lasiodiplodia mahajangana]|uniref:Uncharacterized protein n=1 Tax=Lasiodiplodia mahajangana TaxID=1108764 RepID=A0ACC2JIV5_9PEZI|nr:hypothetical protein O1611_g6257 [Lasiodiplodia mahajangana]